MTEIRSLTGLRGVAAVLVMIDHYAAVDFTAPFPLNVLPHFYLAVDLFMLLSGFVLAMCYEDRLASLPPGEAMRVFLWRRVARLWPLYALTTLVCFALVRAGWLTFLHPDDSFPALVANLLAVQTWFWPGTSLNGPGWSISAEWFANLLFVPLLPLVLGRSEGRAAVVALAAAAGLVFGALCWGQLFDVPSPGATNAISGPGALVRCTSGFVLGLWCWRVRSRHGWARLLADRLVLAGLGLAMLVLIQFTALDTVFVGVCAALLIGLSFEPGGLWAVLRGPVLHYLGRISYSIYLVHIPLLPLRDALARGLEGRVPAAWALAVLATASVALAVAALTRRFVEVPAQPWMLAAPRRRVA